MLATIPELSTAAPAVESWPVGDGRPQWVSPITGLDPLLGPLIEVLERAKSSDVDTFVHASVELAKTDLFVAQFSNLVRDLSDIQGVWAMMGLSRLTTCILHGGSQIAQSASPSISRRIVGLSEAVQATEDKGELLSRMSDCISARVAAALNIAGKSASGLARRMIASRMVWVVHHDSVDPSVDLPWVSDMLGLPLDEGVIQMVHTISHIAIEKSRARVGTRKERAADALLSQILRNAVGDPLMNPGCGPSIVRLLPHLVEPKHIKGRVSDFRLAVRYLDPGAIRTVAGAWADLVHHLAQWDVLSSAVVGFEPVVRTDRGWRLDREHISDDVRWSMRIPRARPQRAHTVVAVRMVELIESGGGGIDVRAAVQDSWSRSAVDGGLFTWIAGHGIGVFACPATALRFASTINRGLIGSDGLLPTSLDPIALPPGMRPSVGVGMGTVVGGFDGDVTTVGGTAVARAMARCGSRAPMRCTDDPLHVRRVSTDVYGLVSSGVACGRPVMLAALNVWGQDVHRFGDENEVAGLARDFATYPVDAWAPVDEGVVLFISLGRSRGAEMVEALWVDHHSLRDLQVRDEDLDKVGEDLLSNETPTLEVEDFVETDVLQGHTEPKDALEADPFGFQAAVPAKKENTALQSKLDWDEIGFGDDDVPER
jgi:hypothetical protein